ncbi:MAG: hypothetical protein K1X66_03500 [Verrucomicrobiae bacterium]|nr:hypothetical protein [Verrucomicrobiae bacterium]
MSGLATGARIVRGVGIAGGVTSRIGRAKRSLDLVLRRMANAEARVTSARSALAQAGATTPAAARQRVAVALARRSYANIAKRGAVAAERFAEAKEAEALRLAEAARTAHRTGAPSDVIARLDCIEAERAAREKMINARETVDRAQGDWAVKNNSPTAAGERERAQKILEKAERNLAEAEADFEMKRALAEQARRERLASVQGRRISEELGIAEPVNIFERAEAAAVEAQEARKMADQLFRESRSAEAAVIIAEKGIFDDLETGAIEGVLARATTGDAVAQQEVKQIAGIARREADRLVAEADMFQENLLRAEARAAQSTADYNRLKEAVEGYEATARSADEIPTDINQFIEQAEAAREAADQAKFYQYQLGMSEVFDEKATLEVFNARIALSNAQTRAVRAIGVAARAEYVSASTGATLEQVNQAMGRFSRARAALRRARFQADEAAVEAKNLDNWAARPRATETDRVAAHEAKQKAGQAAEAAGLAKFRYDMERRVARGLTIAAGVAASYSIPTDAEALVEDAQFEFRDASVKARLANEKFSKVKGSAASGGSVDYGMAMEEAKKASEEAQRARNAYVQALVTEQRRKELGEWTDTYSEDVPSEEGVSVLDGENGASTDFSSGTLDQVSLDGTGLVALGQLIYEVPGLVQATGEGLSELSNGIKEELLKREVAYYNFKTARKVEDDIEIEESSVHPVPVIVPSQEEPLDRKTLLAEAGGKKDLGQKDNSRVWTAIEEANQSVDPSLENNMCAADEPNMSVDPSLQSQSSMAPKV